MRCRSLKLMISLLPLSLIAGVPGCQVTRDAVDSYCAIYRKVIQSKGEGAIQASLAVKKRIAANEVVYRCQCEKWNNPICRAAP